VETGPEIAVVIPSHDRPLRLRWLLNALAEQTLARERFEVVVGHDSSGPETAELLGTHPLAEAGVLRSVTLEPGTAPPGRNRNAAWREARAPVIAFTDDDCRPPPEWLERALAAAARHPGAIVQGATQPDPDENNIGLYSPYVKTQSIVPPRPWAQACNIIYPMEVLDRLGGFPEDMYVGEDTALAESAQATGVPYVAAKEVITRHAIEEAPMLLQARDAWRWRGLPLLLTRHPRLRAEFPLYRFWKREHIWLPAAVAGIALQRRGRLWGALAIPYLVHATPKKYGSQPRSRFRALLDLPGLAVIHAAEIASLAWGSIRHRSLFL
jgi:GT2 family glycosyltransferase